MAFDPRAIPNRAHYDRLMTWATDVFSRMSPEVVAEIQSRINDLGKEASIAKKTDDDLPRIAAALAGIGFAAVLDNMADIIEENGNGNA